MENPWEHHQNFHGLNPPTVRLGNLSEVPHCLWGDAATGPSLLPPER